MPLNFNNRNLKKRTLSPRDQQLLDLLKAVTVEYVRLGDESSVLAQIAVDHDGNRTVYKAESIIEAFAMGFRGTTGSLLQAAEKRGGVTGKYKLVGIEKCPEIKA